MGLTHRFQIDLAAHPPVENKSRLGDAKAPAQGPQQPLQGFVVGAVAPQDRNVQGNALGIGSHGQQDLRPIRAMIPAVTVVGQPAWTFAFKISARQIIERELQPVGKSLAVEVLFQFHPMAVHLVHRFVQIVFVEGFVGLQTARLRQPGALGLHLQTELGAGKKQPGVDHGLEQFSLARGTHGGQKAIQFKALPGRVEDRQTAVVQSLMELHGMGGNKGLAFEGGGDEIAGVGGQIGDIANGAGARPLECAEGLANEVGNVGFAAFAFGSGGLDKHWLQ